MGPAKGKKKGGGRIGGIKMTYIIQATVECPSGEHKVVEWCVRRLLQILFVVREVYARRAN